MRPLFNKMFKISGERMGDNQKSIKQMRQKNNNNTITRKHNKT